MFPTVAVTRVTPTAACAPVTALVLYTPVSVAAVSSPMKNYNCVSVMIYYTLNLETRPICSQTLYEDPFPTLSTHTHVCVCMCVCVFVCVYVITLILLLDLPRCVICCYFVPGKIQLLISARFLHIFPVNLISFVSFRYNLSSPYALPICTESFPHAVGPFHLHRALPICIWSFASGAGLSICTGTFLSALGHFHLH